MRSAVTEKAFDATLYATDLHTKLISCRNACKPLRLRKQKVRVDYAMLNPDVLDTELGGPPNVERCPIGD